MACDKPWLEHYDEGVPTSIDAAFIPLGMLRAHSATTKGAGIAITFGLRVGPWAPCRQLTWNEVEEATERLAAGLQALGIRKGERVAILLPNCPQMVLAMFAIWRIGAISVMCNPVHVAHELEHTLLDSGARVMIAMNSFADSVAAIRAMTALERVVLTGTEEYLPGSLKLLVRLRRLGKSAPGARFSEDPGVMWLGDLLKNAPESHIPVDLAPGDGAVLLYTSGISCEYRTGYGLTESGGAVTIEPKSGSSAGSVGLPVPDTDVRVVDSETGSKELEAGEPGEIIVRGPQLMDCYWNRPKDTAAVLRTGPDAQSGWLYTGDIGYLDRAGFLFISDRRTDLIINGGNNVYPAEVEDVLLSHPSVAEAAVVGVADEARGETVKACVVLQAGHGLNCQVLTKHCEERLAAYKIPLRFEQFEALPKSAVGKILRRDLRE